MSNFMTKIPSMYIKIMQDKVKYCYNKYTFGDYDKKSLLYLACGNGDILVDQVLPILSHYLKKIMGFDNSSELIRRASFIHDYACDFIRFKVVDFLSKNYSTNEWYDHIVSFWDIRWLSDSRTFLQNFSKTMTLDCSGLVMFETKNTLFDAVTKLAKDPQWQPYLMDYEFIVYPCNHDVSYLKQDMKLLDGCYFEFNDKESITFLYSSIQELKDTIEVDYEFQLCIPKEQLSTFYEQLAGELQSPYFAQPSYLITINIATIIVEV